SRFATTVVAPVAETPVASAPTVPSADVTRNSRRFMSGPPERALSAVRLLRRQRLEFTARAIEDVADFLRAPVVFAGVRRGLERRLHQLADRSHHHGRLRVPPLRPVFKMCGAIPDALDGFGFACEFA